MGGLVSMQDLMNVASGAQQAPFQELSVTRPRKVHTVAIKDLQSEERRDLVSELMRRR